MKQSLFKWGIAPLFACAFLAPKPMLAQAVKGQSTGWMVAEWLPGIPCGSASGEVHLLGEVHVVKMVSADPLGNGRVVATMNQVIQSDGTATFSGTASVQLGTWEGLNFTPTTGVWDVTYSGVVDTEGVQYTMSGRGIGGSIDGLHMKANATRGPLRTDAYHFSWTITAVGHE